MNFDWETYHKLCPWKRDNSLFNKNLELVLPECYRKIDSTLTNLFRNYIQPVSVTDRGTHEKVHIDHPDHRAAMFAVKLNKQSEYVFRFEILRDQVTKQTFKEVEAIISALAQNSIDIGFPGYPYGLIDADRLGRVSMNEKTAHAFQFKTAASRKGLWEKISKFIKSSDAHEILNKLIG